MPLRSVCWFAPAPTSIGGRLLLQVVLLNVRILNKVPDIFVIPSDALSTIFSNVEDIFTLHTTTILPKLENRLENWYVALRVCVPACACDVIVATVVLFSVDKLWSN